MIRLSLLLASLLVPSAAAACTICSSPGGAAVRDQVLGAGFWATLGITVAPFAVLLPIVLLVHHGGSGRRISTTTRSIGERP